MGLLMNYFNWGMLISIHKYFLFLALFWLLLIETSKSLIKILLSNIHPIFIEFSSEIILSIKNGGFRIICNAIFWRLLHSKCQHWNGGVVICRTRPKHVLRVSRVVLPSTTSSRGEIYFEIGNFFWEGKIIFKWNKKLLEKILFCLSFMLLSRCNLCSTSSLERTSHLWWMCFVTIRFCWQTPMSSSRYRVPSLPKWCTSAELWRRRSETPPCLR